MYSECRWENVKKTKEEIIRESQERTRLRIRRIGGRNVGVLEEEEEEEEEKEN